jgi:hypothetical protein
MGKFTDFIKSAGTVTAPADDDKLALIDESASLSTHITWASVKARLGEIFAPKANPTFTGTTTTAALTATGDVRVVGPGGSTARLTLDATNSNNPELYFDRGAGGANLKLFRVVLGGDGLYFQSRTDADGLKATPLVLGNGAAPVVDMTGATSVEVPAATAATHAAQVSAITSGTGQLQIGGIEMGDTGWRNVASGVINGFTATEILIRRTGNTVHFRFQIDGTSKTDNNFYLCDSGFRGQSPNSYYPYRTGSTTVVWGFGGVGWAVASTSSDIRAAYSYPTNEAWPTSLPGTAA